MVEVLFGGLAKSLVEQGFDDDDGHLQKDADAITRLHVRGLLTEQATHGARKKLAKQLKPLSRPGKRGGADESD